MCKWFSPFYAATHAGDRYSSPPDAAECECVSSMTTSTLGLSLKVSACVSFANRRVLPLASAGAGPDAEVNRATLGFAELCVNATASAMSRFVGIFYFYSSSLLRLPHHRYPAQPRPLLPTSMFSPPPWRPGQAYLYCPSYLQRTLQHRHEIPGARIVPCPRFPLAAVWRSHVRSCSSASDLHAPCRRGGKKA